MGIIQQRGILRVATDISYVVPQSQRGASTRCPATMLTANQLTGFDIGVAVALAQQIGVEPCFSTPPFADLTNSPA